MGWVERGSGRYYVRSVWVRGRPVTRYIGRGEVADIVARRDAIEREWKRFRRREFEEERVWLQETEEQVIRACDQVEPLASAALVAAGFHKHNRGVWRRRIMKNEVNKAPESLDDALKAALLPHPGRELPLPDDDSTPPEQDQSFRPILDLIERAQAGDESARPQLRRVLAHPQGQALMVQICGGDLARRVRDALIAQVSSGNIMVEEATRARVETLRDELAGPDPGPIVRVLAERAALCWLDAHAADLAFLENMKGMQLTEAEFRERMRARANARFLAAARSLMQVQKLAASAIRRGAHDQQADANPVAPAIEQDAPPLGSEGVSIPLDRDRVEATVGPSTGEGRGRASMSQGA